jgi:hypothetical protein
LQVKTVAIAIGMVSPDLLGIGRGLSLYSERSKANFEEVVKIAT